MSRCIEFTSENLAKLKRIEREAYEGTGYMQMQYCTSWESVASYCECSLDDLHIAFIDDGYVIAACHEDYMEIVDLASSGRNMNLFAVWDFLKEIGKPMIFDARESTSYRLIKLLERRGEISIVEDTPHPWGGETFHDVRCTLNPSRGTDVGRYV